VQELQIPLLHRLCTTLKVIKTVYTTTTVFGLLAPGHHQVSLTGLDQSEGQDLVHLQYILKVTIYFCSHKLYYMVERVKSGEGEGGGVKSLAKSNKLKA
jgi:hypothetical protein